MKGGFSPEVAVAAQGNDMVQLLDAREVHCRRICKEFDQSKAQEQFRHSIDNLVGVRDAHPRREWLLAKESTEKCSDIGNKESEVTEGKRNNDEQRWRSSPWWWSVMVRPWRAGARLGVGVGSRHTGVVWAWLVAVVARESKGMVV